MDGVRVEETPRPVAAIRIVRRLRRLGVRTPCGGSLDPGANVRERIHDPAEFEAAELEQFTRGRADRGRRAPAALDQGDLADESAVHDRADECAKALDLDGAMDDDEERLRRFT